MRIEGKGSVNREILVGEVQSEMSSKGERMKLNMGRSQGGAPWGFRLHGGADFGTRLSVQKVNTSSPSESSGLRAGDVLIEVNGKNIEGFRHKEAQDFIIRAGNRFELTVQRGTGVASVKPQPQQQQQPLTQTWKPSVTPVGPMPSAPTPSGTTFTKTSLAATPQEDSHWDVKHNTTAKGFIPSTFQTPKPQSYNSPVGLYSDANIKEVLDQHSETLATGVKGINFNQQQEQNTDVTNSATLKMVLDQDENSKYQSNLQQQQQQPFGSHSGFGHSDSNVQSTSFKLLQRALETNTLDQADLSTNKVHVPKIKQDENLSGFKSVCAPISKPRSTPAAPPHESNKCHICKNPIVGVFVKVAGNPLHPDCFKCFTCRESLRNKGYFNIGGNLYCETHARQAKASQMITSSTPAPPSSQNVVKNDRNNGSSTTLWSAKLEKDKAGMADNAEDFTKQFMQHMYGGGGNLNNNNILSNNNDTVAVNNQRNLTNTALSSSSMKQKQHNFSNFQKPTPSHSSNDLSKPKKGGAFQWPPKKDDEPSTAAPMYIDPRDQQNGTSQEFPSQAPVPPPQQQPSWKPQQSSQMAYQQPQPQYQPSQSFQQQQQKTYQKQESYQTTKSFSQISEKQEHQSYGSTESKAPVPILKNTIPSQHHHHPHQDSHVKFSTDVNAESAFNSNANNPPPSSGKGQQQQNVSSPRRGRGILQNQQPGMRVPVCGACNGQIRGPFITALGRTWCPNHFVCNQSGCDRSLQEVGFVEEKGRLYCEDCYGKYLAPDCDNCKKKILGNCLKAMNKSFHPECFTCAYCGKIFANSPFYLEDGLPYCEEDWNELFTTKCVACGFPIEAGDRWVEALDNNYHSQCFNCTLCKKNLEGKGFFVKAGKPFCKSHARFGA